MPLSNSNRGISATIAVVFAAIVGCSTPTTTTTRSPPDAEVLQIFDAYTNGLDNLSVHVVPRAVAESIGLPDTVIVVEGGFPIADSRARELNSRPFILTRDEYLQRVDEAFGAQAMVFDTKNVADLYIAEIQSKDVLSIQARVEQARQIPTDPVSLLTHPALVDTNTVPRALKDRAAAALESISPHIEHDLMSRFSLTFGALRDSGTKPEPYYASIVQAQGLANSFVIDLSPELIRAAFIMCSSELISPMRRLVRESALAKESRTGLPFDQQIARDGNATSREDLEASLALANKLVLEEFERAIAFLIAHEIGHVRFGSSDFWGFRFSSDEAQCDEFAYDVCKKTYGRASLDVFTNLLLLSSQDDAWLRLWISAEGDRDEAIEQLIHRAIKLEQLSGGDS